MKKTESVGNYGVALEDVVIERHFENNDYKYLFHFVVLFLGAYGTIRSFLSCYQFGLDSGMVFMSILLLCIIFYGIFQYVRFYSRVIVGMIASLLIVCSICNRALRSSLDAMLSMMKLKKVDDSSVGPGFCLFVLTAILIMIMAYAVIIKKNMFLIALCSLPIACLGLFFGLMPSGFALLCIGMYIAAMAAVTGEKTEYRNTSVGFASAVVMVLFLIYLLVLCLFPEREYKRIQLFDTIKMNIEDAANNLPVDGINDAASGGINAGKLGNFDKVTYNNTVVLRLNSGDIGIVYLRGFVGAKYEHNSWTDVTLKSGEKFLKDLNAQSFEIYNQTSEFWKIVDSDKSLIKALNGDVTSYMNHVFRRDFTVENLAGSSRFFYLPYGNMYFAREKSSPDGYPVNTSRKFLASVTYSVDQPDYQKYKDLVDNYQGSNRLMLKYKTIENTYRNYVNTAYLEVDSKYKDFLHTIRNDCSFHNEAEKQEVIQSIKDYLAEHYIYTLEPGVVPDGKDFVDYFLFESKQGYCTYFATAATMLFRAAGIPARYVEGYAANVCGENIESKQIVTEERSSTVFDTTQSYTQYTTQIKDKDAHAWVEIYQDGYGWVPIEVTPGKTNQTDLTSDTTFTDKSSQYVNPDVVNAGPLNLEDEADNLSQGTTTISSSDNYEQFKLAVLHFVKVLFIGIMILLLMMSAILIPAKISEKKRDQLFMLKEDTDYRQTVIMIYSYIEKISIFLKMYRPDSMSYIDYYARVKERYDYLDRDGIDYIISAALKVRFSEADITKEEMSKVIESAIRIRQDSSKRLKRLDRLKYRFIYHLI